MDNQKKKSKGRQKIAMQKIEKESDCYATFSKRRLGLFKKASELSTLCDADVGLFIFSPTGKPFSFFHPSMEAVMSRFRSSDEEKEKEKDEEEDDDVSRLLEAYSRTRVLQLNQMLDKIGEKLDCEVEREKQLDDMVMREKAVCERWWEEEPAENLEKEQVEQLINLMRNLQSKLSNQREKTVTEI